MNQQPTPSSPNRRSSLRQRLLWALAVVMLLELAVGLIFHNVGSYVFTERDGTYTWELWFSEAENEPPTKVRPYRVALDSTGKPARLFIRYASGNGSYYMTEGDVSLVSATGESLWSMEFEGFTDDVGPNLFAFAFADADGDGHAEVFYRHVESDYREDENGTDCSWKLGPLRVAQLEGDNETKPNTLRSVFVTRIMAMQLAFPLLDGFHRLGILLLFPIPPLVWLATFLIGRRRRAPGFGSSSTSSGTCA